MASQENFIKHLEKSLPILLKLFQIISEEGTLPNSFNEVTITVIPKPDKDNIHKKTYRPISLMKYGNIEVKSFSHI